MTDKKPLTRRQRIVLALYQQGLTQEAIAQKLGDYQVSDKN